MRSRSWLAAAFVALPALALAGSSSPPPMPLQQVAAELEAARHTRELIQQKLDARDGDLRVRVRALYKLTAFGDLPLWVDDGARDDFLHRRAAGSRMLVRDLEERATLRAELARADADVTRLSAATGLALLRATPPVPPGSLWRPVPAAISAPFGIYADDATKMRISRHGVELAAGSTSFPVSAAADARVLYAGPIRGLGTAVLLAHGQSLVTITANLATVSVARNQTVVAGGEIGTVAPGVHVYFEARLAGRPVDPAPLLRALP